MGQIRRKQESDRLGRGRDLAAAGLRVDAYTLGDRREAMIADVRRGLSGFPKTLPPKYLYDEVGAQLFDEICDQPEYYPTRTEDALLVEIAGDLIDRYQPEQLVELGSGASRKTRTLLDALVGSANDPSYVPVDVAEEMLRGSANALALAYPALQVHGIVGDYEHHLRHLPPSQDRMVAFLGSTIGNFSDIQARQFLRAVRGQLAEGDAFLIGFDLVKATEVLNAAYNDAAGVTARFNLNVLNVINRELDADFDVAAFEHEAFFNERESQIEMHLRPTRRQEVRIEGADLSVNFAAGESVRTEISRKFTRSRAETLLRSGGFAPDRWYEPENGYFGLALALAGPVV